MLNARQIKPGQALYPALLNPALLLKGQGVDNVPRPPVPGQRRQRVLEKSPQTCGGLIGNVGAGSKPA